MLKIFTVLLIGVMVHGCAGGNLKKEKKSFGYCVGTEGMHFVHKMISIDKNSLQIEEKKDMLLQDIQSYYSNKKRMDANYYKEVVQQDNSLIVYGYSILDNDLRVVAQTDKTHKHIVCIKYFFPEKDPVECAINYKTNEKTATQIKQCNNDTKGVDTYGYDKNTHSFSLKSNVYYEKGKIIRKSVYKNGIVRYEDFKNKTVKSFEESIGFVDTCMPYAMYDINLGSNLGI